VLPHRQAATTATGAFMMEANRETVAEDEAVGIVISFGNRIEAKPRFRLYMWSQAPNPEPALAAKVA
jgi:hypothetical protein